LEEYRESYHKVQPPFKIVTFDEGYSHIKYGCRRAAMPTGYFPGVTCEDPDNPGPFPLRPVKDYYRKISTLKMMAKSLTEKEVVPYEKTYI